MRDAIEVMGGNGAIEAFSVLPRLLRDSVVLEAWEGGHNVLCAQVLRDCLKLRAHDALFEWLEGRVGHDAGLQRCRARLEEVLGRQDADLHIRHVFDELGVAVQIALLRAGHASDPRDPCEAAAADHLEAISSSGWDPLRDASLATRIRTLTASTPA